MKSLNIDAHQVAVLIVQISHIKQFTCHTSQIPIISYKKTQATTEI